MFISPGSRAQRKRIPTITVTTTGVSPSGRLTLSTGVPVMTSNVAGATTVYFTPFRGNLIPVTFDHGATYTPTVLSELSQATTDNTKSPAAVAASSNYDVFVWNDGVTVRATRGPAWSSNTARGTGAGTTELQLVNGLYVNANAITNGPAAKAGTYVGSIRSNGSSTIDWNLGGSGSGGVAPVLNVWNYFNRLKVQAQSVDSGTSYTYTSATIRQARASSGNQVTFLSGLAEDSASTSLGFSMRTTGATNASLLTGISLDSTSAQNSPLRYAYCFTGSTTAVQQRGVVSYDYAPLIGSHFVAWIQGGDGTNANVFNDNAGDNLAVSFLM